MKTDDRARTELQLRTDVGQTRGEFASFRREIAELPVHVERFRGEMHAGFESLRKELRVTLWLHLIEMLAIMLGVVGVAKFV